MTNDPFSDDDRSPAPEGGETPRSALDWPQHAGTVAGVVRQVEFRLRRRRRRRTVLGVVASVLVVMFLWPERPGVQPAIMVSSPLVSQPARQTLPDGSTMESREGVEMGVDFSGPCRKVILQRGEMYIQVASDPARPFLVLAGNVEVRAVGTAFAVKREPAAVEVLVTEGHVAVEDATPLSAAAEPAPPPFPRVLARAGRGNRVVVPMPAAGDGTLVASVVPLSVMELNRRLAWRMPRLMLAGTPLAEVVPVVVQYSGVRLILADPALGELQLSGVLRADNADALVQLLRTNFNIVAEHRDGNQIFLRRRTDE